jgi:hypothetical protein
MATEAQRHRDEERRRGAEAQRKVRKEMTTETQKHGKERRGATYVKRRSRRPRRGR